MEQQHQVRDLVGRLLSKERFAVLSTQSETGPYSSLVAFWSSEDLRHIVFATMRDTHKFNYLITHPRVALLFDDRSGGHMDAHEATAVTATGTAREVTDEKARTAASVELLAKHPDLAEFVRTPGCTYVRVDLDALYVVTRLQDVVEVDLDE